MVEANPAVQTQGEFVGQEEAGAASEGGEGDVQSQVPVEEQGTLVKVMTKPPTTSPAPTPHPAHILVPIKGLDKPHMQCPDGKVVDETVAYWKVSLPYHAADSRLPAGTCACYQCPMLHASCALDRHLATQEWTDAAPRWKPLTKPPDPSKTYYLSFEPDMAGFNNVRMSLECAIAFAVITGRTLVLPDSWAIGHIGSVAGYYAIAQGHADPAHS